MKPDISEFSYGYAVTEELVAKNHAKVIAAPIFPSLYEEGQKGGGYDVQIPLKGSPIFLQFKLSDHLSRASAKEHQEGLIETPYYRMHLRPLKHSDQHNLLLDLEGKGETVFYIAPEFHLPDELNKYYLSRTVINNSAAFRPVDIGPLPDDDEHYVVFKSASAVGFRCSSAPKQVQRTTLREGFSQALKDCGVEPRPLGLEGIRKLSLKMLSAIESVAPSQVPAVESIKSPPTEVPPTEVPRTEVPRAEASTIEMPDATVARKIIEARSPIESAAYLARTFFGCELVVVP